MKFENTWTGNWKNAFHGLRHPMESYARSDSEFMLIEPWGDEDLDVTTKWLAKDYPDLEEGSNKWVEKSIERSDWMIQNGTIQYDEKNEIAECAFLGPNDIDLAQRMIKAGSPNDKFLRQIFVSVDITAPLYLWKELDTYKVATVANSTSTMHKLASTPITIDCFETDDYNKDYAWGGPIKCSKLFILKDDEQIEEHDDYGLDVGSFPEDVIIPHLENLRLKYLDTKDIRYWKELIRWLPESWLQTRTWTANYATLRGIIHWRGGHKLTEWASFLDWCRTLPYNQELLFYYQKNNE